MVVVSAVTPCSAAAAAAAIAAHARPVANARKSLRTPDMLPPTIRLLARGLKAQFIDWRGNESKGFRPSRRAPLFLRFASPPAAGGLREQRAATGKRGDCPI